ncbi:MAG: CGNR zinc finger domain-containing protein [Chrysiogenia bacterium]
MDSKLQKNSLWLNLLNSDWHDFKGGGRHEDRLDNDVWLQNFLLPWPELLMVTLLSKIRKQLKELRILLRQLADDYSKRKPLRKMDIERLNAVLRSSPEIKKVYPSGQFYEIRREAKIPGISAMLVDIASSFAEILARGEPERIKVCQNPDCLWIFYDTSKNRSRKWCENATGCGNLIKVRMFRAKSKQKSNPGN